jgi:tetratricopeptide (TPR) repeat protein
MRTILGFYQDHLLAAGRPKGQSGGLGRDVSLRAAVDAAASKLETVFAGEPLVELSIRDALGKTYYHLGEPAQAIPQWERALQLAKQALSPDHPDTLVVMNHLGDAYRTVGKLSKATELHEEALRRLRACARSRENR